TTVKPRRKLAVLADEPDNRVLECAVAGGAEIVVTGDKDFLALGVFRKVRVASLREYLEGTS
ncbi:MAG TPA: putative toxin-antitoxin system toxin component, PIN family, partial [Dehalococcoidia bacterium]|nr:putative toxin-antitoxin system toxin component, PIN family [Dehalococcoidia bacterium]